MALENMTIRLPSHQPVANINRAALAKLVENKTGKTGWSVDSVDPKKNLAILIRQVSMAELDQDNAVLEITLPGVVRTSDGDKIAARQAELHPGYFMVKFKPHLNQALLAKMNEDELRCRDAVANALGVKPWDVMVSQRRDKGFSLQLPGVYAPSKHDAKLTEVAEQIVGRYGWYVKVDPRTLVAQIIPSDPPTFPDVAPLPMRNLGKNQMRTPVGLALPKPGEKASQVVEIDWKAQAFGLVSGLPGAGKALSINTPVPVPVSQKFPSGWASHGDLVVGDEVFAADGTIARVTHVSPRERRRCYRVTFEDGTVVTASDNHLWTVSTFESREINRGSRLSATKAARERRAAKVLQAKTIATAACASAAGMTARELAGVFSMSKPNAGNILRSAGVPYETIRGKRHYAVDEFATAYIERLEAQSPRSMPLHTTLSTEQMSKSVKAPDRPGCNNYAVDVPGSLALPHAELPLDSYLLGAWLGDGDSKSGMLSVGPQDFEFSKTEYDRIWGVPAQRVVEQYNSRGDVRLYRIYYGRPRPGLCKRGHDAGWWYASGGRRTCTACGNYKATYPFGSNESLTEVLNDLGLITKKNETDTRKHIPALYLRSSRDQRLALLQGLMDTDGTVNDRGECGFTAANERLALGVLELIRSLGIRASMRHVQTAYTLPGERERREGRGAWLITFTTDQPVFRMPRKLSKITSLRTSRTTRNHIVSIEQAGIEEVSCIRIDHPTHLYLVEGFIPTHNTVVLNDIVADHLAAGGELVVVDDPSKSIDFFWAKPYVRDGGWGCGGLRQAITSLMLMYEEGQRRAQWMSERGYVNWLDIPETERFKPILAMIDEVSALLVTEKLPPGVDKNLPEVQEVIEANRLKFKLQRRITKIIAEQRFVGMRAILSTQVTNNTTGLPPSLKSLLGQKALMGSNPSKTQRQQAFNVETSVPTIPPNLVSGGTAAKGVGATEFEGQAPSIFKGFFATTSELAAELDRRGIRKTARPEPSEDEMDRLCPTENGDDLDDEGPEPMVAGERLPSGKPLSSLPPEFGPQVSYDENGKRLRGAAAAAHQSKQITDSTSQRPVCPRCAQPIAPDGSCGCG